MMTEDLHKALAARIGLGDSERMRRLWAMVCDEDEARLLLAMPGTAEELAEKTGRGSEEVEKMIGDLFYRGVVFESLKGDVLRYKMSRNLVQFHDATILWKEAPEGFVELWKEYMEEEYPEVIKVLVRAGIKGFMRVIPVNRTIEDKSDILPYELAARMVGDADKLAVTDCTCRLSHKNCDRPLEVCLQLNRGAEYAIKRGSGREITKEEARKILDESEEAGLVHVADNRAGLGNVLCNCCPCCCQMLVPMVEMGLMELSAPSRFRAVVDAELCTGDEECVERCPMKAIKVEEDVAAVDEALCIGCGLCVTVCPSSALALEEVRPAEFIPGG